MSEISLEQKGEKKIINQDYKIGGLKNSIKSDIVKSMLNDEDFKKRNNTENNKQLISSKQPKSNKPKNINKIPKNNKENNDIINNQTYINKIKPKSKTIKNLMNEHNNKEILKSIKKNSKKKINDINGEIINKNIIIKNEKPSSVKKQNYTIKNNNIKIHDNVSIKKDKSKNNIKNVKLNKNESKINQNKIKYSKERQKNRNTNNKNLTKYKSFSQRNANTQKLALNSIPNIPKNIKTEPNKTIKNNLYNTKDKNQIEKNKSFFLNNDKLLIKDKQVNSELKNTNLKEINNNKLKLNNKTSLISKEIKNVNNIININNDFSEKNIQDFITFLKSIESDEINYAPKIKNTLDLFKKGNKVIKRYIHLPKYQYYSNNEIIKDFLFRDILSFLLPYEQYFFAKTNKESLIKYMKIKGSEEEILLDNYNLQKEILEKKLNKNKNIKITKNNFFNNEKLNQIFKLLNNEIYLNIFNDKTKTPNDNIIFIYKLFFLLIKNTEKLIQLNNNIFWEKICDYFINNTNEFNQSDLLLGDLIKKILEQKLNFTDDNLKRIYDIIVQIDLKQIEPTTFSKDSPTTSQFCYIIKYFLEFFGIIESEWSPLENEYIMLQYKIHNSIKKINKIGLYIVNLKYKNNNK